MVPWAHKSQPQKASRSFQLFLHSTSMWPTDRQTHRPCYVQCVAAGRISGMRSTTGSFKLKRKVVAVLNCTSQFVVCGSDIVISCGRSNILCGCKLSLLALTTLDDSSDIPPVKNLWYLSKWWWYFPRQGRKVRVTSLLSKTDVKMELMLVVIGCASDNINIVLAV